jgi:hypothetical protein
MNKGIQRPVVERVLADCAAAGLNVRIMVISGLPGETDADMQATLDFLQRHRARIDQVGCSPFTLFAGSDMARRPADFGLTVQPGPADGTLAYRYDFAAADGPSPAEARARHRRMVEQLAALYPAMFLWPMHQFLYRKRYGPDLARRTYATGGRSSPPEPFGDARPRISAGVTARTIRFDMERILRSRVDQNVAHETTGTNPPPLPQENGDLLYVRNMRNGAEWQLRGMGVRLWEASQGRRSIREIAANISREEAVNGDRILATCEYFYWQAWRAGFLELEPPAGRNRQTEEGS